MRIQNACYQAYYNKLNLKNNSINKNNVETSHFGADLNPARRLISSEAENLGISLFVRNKALELLEGTKIVSKKKVIVGGYGTPTDLMNCGGDIIIKPGVEVTGLYQATGGIVFEGNLAKSGQLLAEKDISVNSPQLFGQIKSEQGDIQILNVDSFIGLVLEGKNISISSDLNSPINQAFINAFGNVGVFCPLDCSMIKGRKVILYPDAVLRNTRINAQEVYINSRLEKGTVVNAGIVRFGEDSRIDESVKILANQIYDA